MVQESETYDREKDDSPAYLVPHKHTHAVLQIVLG